MFGVIQEALAEWNENVAFTATFDYYRAGIDPGGLTLEQIVDRLETERTDETDPDALVAGHHARGELVAYRGVTRIRVEFDSPSQPVHDNLPEGFEPPAGAVLVRDAPFEQACGVTPRIGQPVQALYQLPSAVGELKLGDSVSVDLPESAGGAPISRVQRMATPLSLHAWGPDALFRFGSQQPDTMREIESRTPDELVLEMVGVAGGQSCTRQVTLWTKPLYPVVRSIVTSYRSTEGELLSESRRVFSHFVECSDRFYVARKVIQASLRAGGKAHVKIFISDDLGEVPPDADDIAIRFPDSTRIGGMRNLPDVDDSGERVINILELEREDLSPQRILDPVAIAAAERALLLNGESPETRDWRWWLLAANVALVIGLSIIIAWRRGSGGE